MEIITKETFNRIKELKEQGLTRNQAANRLDIANKTAGKYWDLSPEEFINLEIKVRYLQRHGDEYREDILQILKEFPEMSASQIYNALCRRYGLEELNTGMTTFRNMVADIRRENNIAKPPARTKKRDDWCR